MPRPREAQPAATPSTKHSYELIALDKGWEPWKYQIVHMVDDGAPWGRPGEPICVGWANFETKEAAETAYRRDIAQF